MKRVELMMQAQVLCRKFECYPRRTVLYAIPVSDVLFDTRDTFLGITQKGWCLTAGPGVPWEGNWSSPLHVLL